MCVPSGIFLDLCLLIFLHFFVSFRRLILLCFVKTNLGVIRRRCGLFMLDSAVLFVMFPLSPSAVRQV